MSTNEQMMPPCSEPRRLVCSFRIFTVVVHVTYLPSARQETCQPPREMSHTGRLDEARGRAHDVQLRAAVSQDAFLLQLGQAR